MVSAPQRAHAVGCEEAGAALASWTPKAGIEDGKFWESSGKILFTGLLGAAALAPTEPSMTTVARWVFTQDMPRPGKVSEVKVLLAAAAQSGNPAMVDAADAAALHLGAIWSKDDKLTSSVYATAQTVADPYLDPTVRPRRVSMAMAPDGSTCRGCSIRPTITRTRCTSSFRSMSTSVSGLCSAGC